METGQQKTLRGWKEIATYVGRDVRTVQRWEARRGFPVSRLPGGDGGNVYVLASEVDQWLHSSTRAQTLEPAAIAEGGAAFASLSLEGPFRDVSLAASSSVETVAEADRPGSSESSSVSHSGMGWYGWALGAAASALALAMLLSVRVHQERVQARGTSAPRAESAHGTALSAEANQQYMQAMYMFEKRTPDSLHEAKQSLLTVTVHDPNHAPAWSGLAQVSTLLVEYGLESDAGARTRARTAAERALALDPGLAEPHAVLGFADFFWSGNGKAAESEFQKALQLDPSSALVRSWYGLFLTYEARYAEALEQLNRAQMLQPSSTAILSNRALALGLSGYRDMAIQLLEKAGGDTAIAHVRFNLALLSLVRPCRADMFLREEMALSAMSHSAVVYQFYASAQQAYQRGGEPALWRSIVARGDDGPVGAELLAGAHAALGEEDAAMEVLMKAQRENGSMMDLAMYPLLLPLHHDPRFLQLLHARGLPPAS